MATQHSMKTRSKSKREREQTQDAPQVTDVESVNSPLPPSTSSSTTHSIVPPINNVETTTNAQTEVEKSPSPPPSPPPPPPTPPLTATNLPVEKETETNVAEERKSPPPLIDIESDDEDGNGDEAEINRQDDDVPTTESHVETNYDNEDVNEMYYTHVQSSEPPRIFKNKEAIAYTFTNSRPSPDFYIEILRFGRSLTKFIDYQLRQSAFEKGCKIHVSALVEYEVVKDEFVVDRPEYFISTRSRVFLKDDDDVPESVAEICSALRAETEDLAARGSGFQFKQFHYFKVTICRYQPAAFGKRKKNA